MGGTEAYSIYVIWAVIPANIGMSCDLDSMESSHV